MPRKVPIPARLRGSAFRTADAGFHETTRGRLRGADVEHPFRGISTVYLDVTSTYGLCLAFEPLLGGGQLFSHTTAARLYGMPLPGIAGESGFVADDGIVHVAVLGEQSRPRRRGVVSHGLTAADVDGDLVLGLPVVSACDTWCHLAAKLTREDLVAVGDFLISGRRITGGREPPLATLEDLERAVHKHAGRRGARSLRWALLRLRTDVDSRPESRLRLLLVAAGLPEPLVNQPVLVDAGRRTVHPDLSYPRLQIAFEYEGDGHRTDKRRFRQDIARRELYESAGHRVIRVTADDVFVAPQPFIARVRRVIRERQSQAPRP